MVLDCVRGPEECWCDCHRTGAKHMVACCFQCEYCGRNIRSFYTNHTKECKNKFPPRVPKVTADAKNQN